MKTYIIRNEKYDNWYWAVGWGWMEFKGGHEGEFTIFSEEEKEDYMNKYVMPDDGYWEVFFDDSELHTERLFDEYDDDDEFFENGPFNDYSDDDIDNIFR